MPRYRNFTTALTVLAIASLLAGHAFAGDGGHGQQDPQSQVSSPIGDAYPLLIDPVTGQSLAEVDHPIIIFHEGRELRFTNAQNIETFQANPSMYLNKVDHLIIANQMRYYPLTTCPISGDELGADADEPPVNNVYGNRLIRFCCKSCKSDFRKDPSITMAKLDAAVIAQQKKAYPLTTCPISGKKLGSAGKPQDVVIANRLVRLCCSSCKPKLMANPAKVLAQIDAAWQASGTSPSHPAGDERREHEPDDHDTTATEHRGNH